MALLDCDSAQPAAWCPTTAEEALPSVLGLLPPGPAWDGAADPNTNSYKFWKSIASVTAFTYGRMCAYLKEFHCGSIDESMDQWQEEYGLPDSCDLYGNNLCTKATILGGQDHAIFIAMARDAGWVVTVEDLTTDNLAGRMQAGCSMLAYMPDPINNGSTLGYGNGLSCNFGPAIDHPEPQYWRDTQASFSSCAVPGSNLGQANGPDCCFVVGYYETPTGVATATEPNFCAPENERIDFECPVSTRPRTIFEPCDGSGSYPIAFGNLFTWRVTVDLKASAALQGGAAITAPVTEPSNCVGNFQVGCTPLCVNQPPAEFVLCFLDTIKPAHTILVTSVN